MRRISFKQFLVTKLISFLYKINPISPKLQSVLIGELAHSIFILQNSHFVLKQLYRSSYWGKIRASYGMNSWIYTTNHKRISVNYFNFVTIAGTAGMSLATVIRLEFAYPGVGVLAGDSLQYLSIATSHGVIMVFFMIMPALFGAFGNFLLPTQLGVHDVAFPRLNSAAFWFLPGGLIMLCQLVCVDRRYQRMNCFNIREIQSILKRKFFVDLVTSADHHDLIHNSMLSLRFKTNGLSSIDNDLLAFYNYGTTTAPKAKSNQFINLYSNSYILDQTFNSLTTSVIEFLKELYYVTIPAALFHVSCVDTPNVIISFKTSTGLQTSKELFFLNGPVFASLIEFFECVYEFFIFLESLNFRSLLSTINIASGFTGTFILNFNLSFFNIDTDTKISQNLNKNQSSVFYEADNFKNNNVLDSLVSTESSSLVRFNRFSNPLITANYKSGNYIRFWDGLYPSLVTSFIEISPGVRVSPWFFSTDFITLFTRVYKNFNTKFTNPQLTQLVDVTNWYSTYVQPMDNFFNVIGILRVNDSYLNTRWVSVNSLNQKFYKMFTSSSTQQRILSNWRQLKFTREAWRCKLLAARHQNTIFRRFTGEEGLVWSVERNAKDLLPGWAMVTPFSARTRYTAIGKTDIGLMGVLIVLNASIVSSANFLVTYRYLSTLNNRKMRDARSFFTESLIVASWMMLAANPMLVIGIIMLLCDRHWQTSFFDYSGGGDTVLFQHMFWFFGHPEVYVIMIPVFGFVNTILSFYLRKRVSARASLMYSMYTIAFLGFFVWGHHMYMVGLSHTTRMLFSTLTVMISVPAATKLMHWCVTLVNSFFTMELPFLWAFTFVYFFVSGGVSGMCVAHTGMDVLFHDTFYVIGHFHVMLAGSGMIGIFAAFYFYFPAIYGVRYSRIYAYIHYLYYVIGQLLTVIPMMWLGYCGMPRRVLDYPSAFGGWHSIASAGHLLSVFAILSFFLMIYDSVRQAKPTIRNNFGVGRFNTRLNFYLFEINRLSFIQRKNLHHHRFIKSSTSSIKELNPLDIVNLETTLFSYRFYKN